MKIVYPGDLRPWEQVGESVPVIETRFGSVYSEQWKNPVSGDVYTFPAQIRIGNYLSILPITKEGNLVLTGQWKQGAKMVCPQFPGGALPPDDFVTESARAKLLAETGYQAGALDIIHVDLHFFDSRCPDWYWVVIATECEHIGRPASPGTDVIQVQEVTPSEFWEMIDRGEIHEPAAYAGALFALRRGYLSM